MSAVIVVANAENQRVWSFDWEHLSVSIYSPHQAYPGDNITLQVAIKAEEILQDIYVTIGIHGALSEGYDEWTTYLKVLDDEDFSVDELRYRNFTVNTPPNVSSGLIYGHIYCAWKVYDAPVWKDRSYEDSFDVIYLVNKELEDLRTTYDELNATYHFMLGNYTELDSKYTGELGGARNLMYVFVATTTIAVATVLYLVLRKPKAYWS